MYVPTYYNYIMKIINHYYIMTYNKNYSYNLLEFTKFNQFKLKINLIMKILQN